MFTVETIESIYKNNPTVKDVDIQHLNNFTSGKRRLIKDLSMDWLIVAQYHNHQLFIDAYMLVHDVPDGLTFKEQMCWLQLLTDK